VSGSLGERCGFGKMMGKRRVEVSAHQNRGVSKEERKIAKAGVLEGRGGHSIRSSAKRSRRGLQRMGGEEGISAERGVKNFLHWEKKKPP